VSTARITCLPQLSIFRVFFNKGIRNLQQIFGSCPGLYFHYAMTSQILLFRTVPPSLERKGRSVRYGRIQQGTVFYVAALGNTNDYFLLYGRSRLRCLLHLVNVFRTKGRTLLFWIPKGASSKTNPNYHHFYIWGSWICVIQDLLVIMYSLK
jgi:hypothetical protein